MASFAAARSMSFQKSSPGTKDRGGGIDDCTTPRAIKRNNMPKPLQSNTLGNLQSHKPINKEQSGQQVELENMLTRLKMNDSRKAAVNDARQLAVSSKQSAVDHRTDSDISSVREQDQSSGSELFTPATESFEETARANAVEMAKMKEELQAARNTINRQQQELEITRSFKHTMDQALSSPSESDFPHGSFTSVSTFDAAARPFTSTRGSGWRVDDHDPEVYFKNGQSGLNFGRQRSSQASISSNGYRGRLDGDFQHALSTRTFSGASSNGFSDIAQAGHRQSHRQIPFQNRHDQNLGASYLSSLSPTLPHAGLNSITLPMYHNLDLTARMNMDSNTQFAAPISIDDYKANTSLISMPSPYNQTFGQSFVNAAEPMNYRRLLDKSVSCDWKYIVDKIVCNNDQQASIFLQQKLKLGTAEQKFDIVEAIINQAYPLMINRFGNFLVQRCFEHGTVEQVTAIADAIHGNVISLSMDPFGCHVVQKAFDSVPENHKADMVRELLRRIPDTVIHRYACHVWQKLFELRWSGEPPQIMAKVNAALKGMWHEVALGETGSLVVQNIFENCIEEEKRPAINEVMDNIDLIAHGQFGNWCIQHLCEHAEPKDQRRVIDHILANAYSYSIDQYASKVVEKCLKISGLEFLDRYLTVITTPHPDRPRIPLIDIAGDQYGNYLVQWILMNVHQQSREQVAVHIRKHMVSLRGSKFGSRVAMLCCNPASVTRPSNVAPTINPYGAPGQPRNQFTRFR